MSGGTPPIQQLIKRDEKAERERAREIRRRREEQEGRGEQGSR